MRDIVLIRAHRILKRMKRYQDLTSDLIDPPPYIRKMSLQKGEVLIGVYENMPGESDESIVVTDLGIHVFRDENPEFIGYDQIDHIEGPPNKQDAAGLVAHLADHRITPIPIKGRDGKFRDVFGFLHFLKRVIEDIRAVHEI